MTNPFEAQERQDAAADLLREHPLGLTGGSIPGRNEQERNAAIAEKVRENRLRRAAERQGFQLEKSRRRDPRALDYGTYQIVRKADGELVAQGSQSSYGLSLDDVERFLMS